MAFRRPKTLLRPGGIDRDVYQIIKKMEDANDGHPFKSVTAAYDAIKRSNSSLSRQKKRPLEDSIERVMQFRKEEQEDSHDSDAEIEELEAAQKPEEDRFLLNRQMTKFWNQSANTSASTGATEANGTPAHKKRRIEGPNETQDPTNAGEATPAATVQTNGVSVTVSATTEKAEKSLAKKISKPSVFKVEQAPDVSPLGGVSDIYQEMLERLQYRFNKRKPPSHLLLSGPSGVGKKSLVRLLAAEMQVPIISIARCFRDAERLEKRLVDAFEEAMRLAPCIILVENLDICTPKSGSTSNNEPSRLAAAYLTDQMQRLKKDQPRDLPVVAIATTSRIDEVDPAVLRPDVFKRNVTMKVPDYEARLDIFRLLTKDVPLAEDVDLTELAKTTHGFVGQEVLQVIEDAEEVAWKRSGLFRPAVKMDNSRSEDMDGIDVQEHVDNPPVAYEHFKTVIQSLTPALRKEGFTQIPNVTWDQVGALEEARKQLKMSIVGPIKQPKLWQEFGLRRPGGVLLWGPPGCGKTLVAQAVANDAQASFILINGPELLNKYVGESERAVRELFRRARSAAPCILFFDEIDSIVPRRENTSTEAGARVVNALLAELDGVQDRSGVYVIGTTNRKDMIDDAMLRHGRLSVHIFVDLPTADERVDILKTIYRKNRGITADIEARLEGVARDPRCENFSGADLAGLDSKAAETALTRYLQVQLTQSDQLDQLGQLGRGLTAADWEHALAHSKPSVKNPEFFRKLARK